MKIRESYKKVREGLIQHLVDTTGVMTIGNPMFAFSENVLAGLSDKISEANRIDSTILFYGGAGLVFSKGRDLYYKLLKIENPSKIHDSIWGAIFGTVFTGAVTAKNAVMNSQSIEEVISNTIAGTWAGALTGAVTGFPCGYFIDGYRDLTDVSPSNRIPNKIRNLPSKIKKGIAVGLAVASIGVVGGIYKATPENYNGINDFINPPKAQEIILEEPPKYELKYYIKTQSQKLKTDSLIG